MRYETIGAAVVGFRGLVWAIGGFLEHGEENIVLASVECYNPMTNRSGWVEDEGGAKGTGGGGEVWGWVGMGRMEGLGWDWSMGR